MFIRPRSRRRRLLAVRVRLPPLDTAAIIKNQNRTSPQIAPRSRRDQYVFIISGSRRGILGYTVDSQGFIDKSDLYGIIFRSVTYFEHFFEGSIEKCYGFYERGLPYAP